MTQWNDSLLDGLPDTLLRWFACDCAERMLEQEREANRETDERSTDAVRVARSYALGLATFAELAQAREGARSASHDLEALGWGPHGTDTYEMIRVCHATAYVTDPQAGLSARAAATYASVHPGGATKPAQRTWLLARLAYLKAVWAACGERSPRLLHEGTCPIPWEDPT